MMFRKQASHPLEATKPASAAGPVLKVGLITDAHYADADTRNNRYYRESLAKMREAADRLNAEKVDVVIELGDLIDTPQPPDPAKEIGFLRSVADEFGRIRAERHFVLGNHCVSGLTKKQFLDTVGQKRSWYSFDQGGVHCVVLDACFRKDNAPYSPGTFAWTDSEIPSEQRDWLAADLKGTSNRTLVFVHQRLDEAPNPGYRIQSRVAVREILEKSGKVLAVFQGHSHKNELQTIGNIPYCTLAAMVEGAGKTNSGYSILNVFADGIISLTGFRRHADHPLAIKARRDP